MQALSHSSEQAYFTDMYILIFLKLILTIGAPSWSKFKQLLNTDIELRNCKH